MWPRWCELLCGAWLAASPWLLRGPASTGVRVFDAIAGLAIVLLAIACLLRPARPLHLVTLAIALVVSAYGWLARGGLEPVHENHVLTGLSLAMIALVPNEATQPPRAWRAPAPH